MRLCIWRSEFVVSAVETPGDRGPSVSRVSRNREHWSVAVCRPAIRNCKVGLVGSLPDYVQALGVRQVYEGLVPLSSSFLRSIGDIEGSVTALRQFPGLSPSEALPVSC